MGKTDEITIVENVVDKIKEVVAGQSEATEDLEGNDHHVAVTPVIKTEWAHSRDKIFQRLVLWTVISIRKCL